MNVRLIFALFCGLVVGGVGGWLLKGWAAESEYQNQMREFHAKQIEIDKSVKDAQDAWQVWYRQKQEADPLKRLSVPPVE